MRRAIIALALGLIACNDAAAPGSGLGRPPVVSVAPSPGATSVDRNASIVIGFDRALDESAFQATALNVWGRWSGPIAGSTVLEVGNTQLRFTPQVPFAAGERITVSMPRLPGNGNEGASTAHSWTFRARAAAGLLDLTHTGVRTVRMSGEGLIQSYGAYAGDFNRDGYPDLMVPNERSNDVRVFLNDGSGDYGDFVRLLIPGGDTPSTNEGADFNGDGLIDFAVGNAGNDLVSVYRGVGAGAFDHAGSFRADQSVRGLCVLDIDGDGDTDIVTANRDGAGGGNVSILENDGSGSFSNVATLETGGDGETSCAVGDADGDGLLDLFVGAFRSQDLVVLLGDGEGGFTRSHSIDIAGGPWMIAAGDVDGDGNVDVLASNIPQNTVAVVLGDGQGGLRLAGSYPSGSRPVAVDLGDLDGDGDLDAVASNYGSANWTVYENTGSGVLVNPRTLVATAAGSCAILHDRDNDGDLDITGIDEVADHLVLFENRP